MTDMPKVLFDGDFKLEKVEPTFEHAREIFNIVDTQRDYMGQWLEWVDNTRVPEDSYPHLHEQCAPAAPAWYLTVDGKIVGTIDFVRVSEKHKTVEIGYWLSRDFNGRGFMTRSVRALEKFAFEQMGMTRVEIRTDAENIPSQNVSKRLGYVEEGALRGSYVLRGVPRDIFVYSKLKSEWEKENKNA